MAKVKNHNGVKNETSEGMSKYSFQGSPIDQFEHKPTVGERRVMNVTVECVHEGNDIVKDGERHVSKWKVLEAEVGTVSKRAASEESDDPKLPYESGANSEYGDYGVGQPEGEGPDDEVGEDGYTNAERKAAAEGDTPTPATESAKAASPAFSGVN